MATIKAPNSEYNGTSAGVVFIDGIGHTGDPHLLSWFRRHGYEVIDDKNAGKEKAKDLPEWQPEEPGPEWEQKEMPQEPVKRPPGKRARRKGV